MEYTPLQTTQDSHLRVFLSKVDVDRTGICSFHPCSHPIDLHPVERFRSLVRECQDFLESKVPNRAAKEIDKDIEILQHSLSAFACPVHQKSIPSLFEIYARFYPERLGKAIKHFANLSEGSLDDVANRNLSSEPPKTESDEEEPVNQPQLSSSGSVDEWIDAQSNETDNTNRTTAPNEDQDASLAPPNASQHDSTEGDLPSTPVKNMIDSASSSPMSSAGSVVFDQVDRVEAFTPGTEERSRPLRRSLRIADRPDQGDGSPKPKPKRKASYTTADESKSSSEQDNYDDSGSTLPTNSDTQSSVEYEQDEPRTESEIVPDEQEITIYNEGLTVCKDASTYLSVLLQDVKKSVYDEGMIYVAFDKSEDSDVKGLVKVGSTKGDPVDRYIGDKCARMTRPTMTFACVTYNVKYFVGARLAETGIKLELFRQRRKILNCHECPTKDDGCRHSHVEWFEMPLKEVVAAVNRWQWIVQSLALDKDDSIRSKFVDILQQVLDPPDFMKAVAQRLGWDPPPPDVTDKYMEKLMSNSFTMEQGKAQKQAGGLIRMEIPKDMYSSTETSDVELETSENLAMSKDETTSDHQVDSFDEQLRQFDMNLISLIVAFAFLVALQLFQLHSSVEFNVTWGVKVG